MSAGIYGHVLESHFSQSRSAVLLSFHFRDNFVYEQPFVYGNMEKLFINTIFFSLSCLRMHDFANVTEMWCFGGKKKKKKNNIIICVVIHNNL